MLTLSAYFRLPGALRQVGARDSTKRLPRIRNLAAAGFLTFAAAAAPNLLALQTATPPAAETQAGSDEPGYEQPAAALDNSSTDAAADSESLQLENRLRRELLDDRARTLDWWLAVIAIVLTFFGIVIVLAGFITFGNFRKIEKKVRKIEKEAREHLRKIEESGEKVEEIRKNLEGIDAETASEHPTETKEAAEKVQSDPTASPVDRAVAAAISLQGQGRIEDAIRKWQSIADIAEGSDKQLGARAWFSVGYLRGKKSDFKAAVNAYDKAIELKPDLAEAYNNRGAEQHALGRHEAALADFDEVIRLKPDYAGAYSNRGNAKNDLGRHEDAIVDCNEAIRLKPDLAEAYNNRGNAKSGLGRHEAALADCDEAIRLKPDLAKAYNNRGYAKGALGQYEAALADFDEAIRLKPDDAEAYYNRGTAKGALDRHEAALTDYDKAIELKPDDAEAYNNRGAVKGALGRHEAALADYDEAVRLKADDALAYNNRGEAKNALGRHEAALTDYDEAIRLKPNFALAYNNRGKVNAMLGRMDAARRDCKTALALARKAGDGDLAAQVERFLESLDKERNS